MVPGADGLVWPVCVGGLRRVRGTAAGAGGERTAGRVAAVSACVSVVAAGAVCGAGQRVV